MDYQTLVGLAIVIVLVVGAPYVATFFLDGVYGALRSFRVVQSYFKLLTGQEEKKTPTEGRMQEDLDRIEKKETGKITKPTPGGVFVDSPTPKEERELAEAELEKEQRELKERLAEKDKGGEKDGK